MVQERFSLRILVGLTVVLLAGCQAPTTRPSAAGPPQRGAQPAAPVAARAPPATTAPATPPPPAAPLAVPPGAPARENHLSAATRALVAQEHALLMRGDLDGASSTLDRALGIEPNNPLLWVELGRLRLTDSDPHQAEVCGRKALALASGDRGTQRLAGRLVADALRAQQRNQAARDVESQPYMN